MSYDLSAYIEKRLLPSGSELRERMARIGSRVVLGDVEDLAAVTGFFSVTLDGKRTGFEMYCHEITDEQRERFRRGTAIRENSLAEIVTTCDLEFSFHCGLSEQSEQTAARIVAMALAACGNGWFTDPQRSETVRYAPRRVNPTE